MGDLELVKAFQAGDTDAFNRIVLAHKDRVFNLCYRLLGNFEEADEAAQDVFVKVFKALGGFRFEAAVATWLYRIAVNTCKNRLKSRAHRNRQRTVSLNGGVDADQPGPPRDIATDSPDPEAAVLGKQRAEAVQRAIDGLEADFRTVLVLRDVEGLAYDEIARITGARLGTVKSRLARARAELRTRLGDII